MAKQLRVSGVLSMNTRPFEAGMRRASGMMAGFGRSALRLAPALLGLAAAAAGVTTVSRRISTAFQEIDRTAKFSDRIGIATETLGGLGHAAELSGSNVQTLHTALQRMTRRVAEAARGTGEARAAISELGLDARELAATEPDQQFLRIADAMANVGQQGDRVRLAMRLFDTEGVGLVPLLQQGSEAISATVDQAHQLGITFDRETARGIERANDALARMRAATQGIYQNMAIALAPTIEVIAHGMAFVASHADEIRHTIAMIGRNLFEIVRTAVPPILDIAQTFGRAWRSVSASVVSLGALTLEYVDGATRGFRALGSFVESIWTNIAVRFRHFLATILDDFQAAIKVLPTQIGFSVGGYGVSTSTGVGNLNRQLGNASSMLRSANTMRSGDSMRQGVFDAVSARTGLEEMTREWQIAANREMDLLSERMGSDWWSDQFKGWLTGLESGVTRAMADFSAEVPGTGMNPAGSSPSSPTFGREVNLSRTALTMAPSRRERPMNEEQGRQLVQAVQRLVGVWTMGNVPQVEIGIR